MKLVRLECAYDGKSELNRNPVMEAMADELLRWSSRQGWRLVEKDLGKIFKILGDDAARPSPYGFNKSDGDA